jgi:hypothetical protein
MTQTKNTDRYDVTVSHPEWDHTICSYSSKKDALERASYVRTHGSFFCEGLSKAQRGRCHVICYDRLLNKNIYDKPFTKKFISFAKS